MDVIALIGRILFVLIFLGSGTTGHIGQRKGMAQYASSAGIPAAEPLVVVSGVMIVVGGLMVALGSGATLGRCCCWYLLSPRPCSSMPSGSLRMPISEWTPRSTS